MFVINWGRKVKKRGALAGEKRNTARKRAVTLLFRQIAATRYAFAKSNGTKFGTAGRNITPSIRRRKARTAKALIADEFLYG